MIAPQVAAPDAEAAVLGAMLRDPTEVPAVLDMLSFDSFTAEARRAIFEAIRELHRRGDPIDPVTVRDELRRAGVLDQGVGLELTHTADTADLGAAATHYARIVAEHADRRRLLVQVGDAAEELRNGADPADVRARLVAGLGPGSATSSGGPAIRDVAEVTRRVEAAGPVGWLVEGLWPGDAYGVLGAEDKAGKTWAVLDLAVSVATGTDWLNRFGCQLPGPVLLFFGEGGERNLLRRLAAIVADRGGGLGDLGQDLRVATTAPRLIDRQHLAGIRQELETHPARLVVVHPLYLAATGARGADLYAMAEVLHGLQLVCQEAGSALVLTHHWTKGGAGSGPERFTGVGPGAWGRVLGSAAVEQRRQEADGSTTALLRWQFRGSEIGEPSFRMRRRVGAEDQANLSSPQLYAVEVTDEERSEPGEQLGPRDRRVLEVLRGDGQALTVQEIGDRIARDGQGPPLKARTIQRALSELNSFGLIDGEQEPGRPGRWWAVNGEHAGTPSPDRVSL